MAASSLGAFLWAIGQQESGGSYSTVNSSSGALGKYQVMPANVAAWTKKALGHSISTSEFLASPSAQESVARTILGGYYQKYGAAGAAAAWYSGQPDPNATYGNPPVYKYVASVLALMAKAPASADSASPTGGNGSSPSTGTASGGTTTATDAGLTSKPADCLVGFSYGVGYACILTYGQARALEGALLMTAGGIVGAAGLIVLAAYGLNKSGALDQTAAVAGVIPGAGSLARKAASGSAGLKSRTAGKPPAKKEKTSEKKGKAK